MMKKYIITILVMLCCQTIMAQTDGCLIVKEYSIDEWCILGGEFEYFDMDDDGEWDFRYKADESSFGMKSPLITSRNGCCFHANDGEYYYFDNVFYDFDIPFNDTTLRWIGPQGYSDIICSEHNWSGEYHLDTITYKSGIRNGQDGEYYYGWMEVYAVVSYWYDTVLFYIARTAFCTIPNYPLRWGQTSLTEGIEENEAVASASIYPNPANATITITGESLRQIEITNMLGQRVATHQAEGPQATIDISALPTGIYFVGITDENGKRCVQKVVKE